MNDEKFKKKLERLNALEKITDEERERRFKNRNTAYFYKHFYNDNLSFEQNGKMFKAIMDYSFEQKMPDFEDDSVLNIIFQYIKKDLDYSNEEYLLKCANSEMCGEKGGRPSKEYKNVLSDIKINNWEERLKKLCDTYENTFNVVVNTNIKTKLGHCLLLSHGDPEFIEKLIQKDKVIDEIVIEIEKLLNKTNRLL